MSSYNFVDLDIIFESPQLTNFCRISTFQSVKPIVILYHSVRILSLFSFFLSGEDLENLIWSTIDVIISMRSFMRFFIFSSYYNLLDSILAFMMSNWSSDLLSTLFVHFLSRILIYEGQYNINRTMVMVWGYMEQMSVNELITWWNQVFKHVIWVEGFWEIGCKGIGKNLGLKTLDAVAIKKYK